MRTLLMACILVRAVSLPAQTGYGEVLESREGLSPEASHTLLFLFDFASNSDIIGKLSETIKQPSYTTSLSFIGKTGIDATIMGSWISNSNDSMDAFTSELDLMLGYQFSLFSSLTLYPCYSRFIYSKGSNALQKIFTDELHLDIDFNHRFFNIGVTPGFYFGQKSTFYTSFRNYYTINFSPFVFKNTWLNIQPGIDLNLGNFEYLNRFYVDQLKENDYFYQYLLLSREIRHYVYEEKTRNPELTVMEILDLYLEDQISDGYSITSVMFYLPVNYFLGNLCLSAGMYVFIPVHQPDYLYNDVQLFFNAGISYNLDF